MRLTAGDQVVADGEVVDEDGLALDESTLTGEFEPVVREVGAQVWGLRAGETERRRLRPGSSGRAR